MLNDFVQLKAFTKKYKSTTACNNIDFTAGTNSITGILGPNGAGKSTLLKAICGYIYPASGSVLVGGKSQPEEIRKITGYVPEIPELEENQTVSEILYLEAALYSASETKENLQKEIDKAVKICSLEEVLSCKVKNLSKGYKQRVSLAKAICIKPEVLVLDEFSAGLDPSQTVHLRKNIKKLSSETTVIFSTHHIDEAVSLCDDIYILNNGKIAAHGTTAEIIKSTGCQNLEEAFLKLTGEPQTENQF